MTFIEVQAILNDAMDAWHTQHGHAPDKTVHDDDPTKPIFGWDTLNQLLSAWAFDKQLIQPEVRGVNGELANLVIALRTGFPADGYGRMPNNGPYTDDLKIAQISAWITANCPE